MKTLRLVVNRFGFVELPVSSLSTDLDSVTGNYMEVSYDTSKGAIISVKDPKIEFNYTKIKITFIPSQGYRKALYKNDSEIELYPDVDLTVDFTENDVTLSYRTNINDIKIEGKYSMPTKRSERLTISYEKLPYSVIIEIE